MEFWSIPKNIADRIICAVEESAKEVLVRVPWQSSPVDNAHFVFNSYWKMSDFSYKNYKTSLIGLKQYSLPSILFAYKKAAKIENFKS